MTTTMQDVPGWLPHKALAEIAQRNNTTWAEMLSHRRTTAKPHILQARLEAAQLLKSRGWSYSKIGALMKRHHTSVMHWFWREGLPTS